MMNLSLRLISQADVYVLEISHAIIGSQLALIYEQNKTGHLSVCIIKKLFNKG